MASAPPSAAPAHKPRLIALVTLCVSLSAASTDIFLPSMPSIAADLEATAADTQLILSGYIYAYALSMLVYGPLSDRFGRRPVLLGALALYVVVTIGCAFATSIGMLIGLRLVQAFCICAAPVAGRAVIRDTHEVRDAARAMAYVATAFSLTPICAPMVGGMIEAWIGWRGNFFFIAAAGAAVALAMLAWLPETNLRRDRHAFRPRQILRNYAHLLNTPSYVGYALSAAFSFGAIFAYISGSSFVFIELMGLTPEVFGPVFGISAIGFGTGSFLTTRLTPRWGVNGTILRGAVVVVAGGLATNALLLAGVFHWAAIVGPMMLISIGAGLVMPNIQAGALAPFPTMAGAASAMLGCTQMIGASTIGAIVGQTYDDTPYPMTLAMLFSGVALLVVFYATVWRRGDPAPAARHG